MYVGETPDESTTKKEKTMGLLDKVKAAQGAAASAGSFGMGKPEFSRKKPDRNP